MPHRVRRWKRSPPPAAASESTLTTSSTSLPSRPNPPLPVELIELILKHLAFSWKGKRADLARCCLVSRTFLNLARPHLYYTARLGLGDAILSGAAYWHDSGTPKLVEVLRRSPHLANLVRRLKIGRAEEWCQFTSFLLPPSLAAILDHCPQLEELSVSSALSSGVSQALHLQPFVPQNLSHIRSVNLSGLGTHEWILLETLARYRLTHVKIDARWNPSIAILPSPRLLPLFPLSSLDLSYLPHHPGPFLGQLFDMARPTLTHLRVLTDDAASLPPLDTFPLLATLHLRIPSCVQKVPFFATIPSILRGCTALRNLALDHWGGSLTLSNVLAISSSNPSALAANLPPSLQKLHFHSSHFHPSDLVRLVTAAPQAVNLREIGTKPYELHKGERDWKKRPQLPSDDERAELRKVCKERGIRVVAVPRYA